MSDLRLALWARTKLDACSIMSESTSTVLREKMIVPVNPLDGLLLRDVIARREIPNLWLWKHRLAKQAVLGGEIQWYRSLLVHHNGPGMGMASEFEGGRTLTVTVVTVVPGRGVRITHISAICLKLPRKRFYMIRWHHGIVTEQRR